jgi:hypothetical protein
MAKHSPIVTIRPRRAKPVLVCRKCLKRSAHGRELKQALKAELKRRSKALALKRPRLVMTSCFDICPKRAVVVASGTTLNRGEYLLWGRVTRSRMSPKP